jgi:hypothetical protein
VRAPPLAQESGPPRPLGEVLVMMLKLGTIAFGGPAVHVAMLREETVRDVERRRCGPGQESSRLSMYEASAKRRVSIHSRACSACAQALD